MATVDQFRDTALSFPGTEEVAHFEKRAFRSSKKIFASLVEAKELGVAILTPAEQYVFCKMDEENIYPVPNKWGLKGCTCLNIKKIPKKIIKEILETAYNGSFIKRTR
jgi:hypothetical protein